VKENGTSGPVEGRREEGSHRQQEKYGAAEAPSPGEDPSNRVVCAHPCQHPCCSTNHETEHDDHREPEGAHGTIQLGSIPSRYASGGSDADRYRMHGSRQHEQAVRGGGSYGCRVQTVLTRVKN
jgi:hypothetical protein